MSLINVWRIPIVFMISGMGIRFAMEHRNWKALLKDRTVRILVPYLFGFGVIGPLNLYFASLFYQKPGSYIPNPGHLWFLGHIYTYVLVFLAVLNYLINHPDHVISLALRKLFEVPYGIYLLVLPFLLEAILVNPKDYPAYFNTQHGFWLGLICFCTGFVFISMKERFWAAVSLVKKVALVLAVLFYLIRLVFFELSAPNPLIAFESFNWMLAIIGFGSSYLNKPSRTLSYLSQAVFPVYILHLPLQFLFALLILPTNLPAISKLLLLLMVTLGASLLTYELIIKRLKWIRPLFGMKINPS